ncbi:MAG: regulatory protein RecX [Gammaproteobacteria bacterium]
MGLLMFIWRLFLTTFDEHEVRRTCFRLLARRDYSKFELISKLKTKGFCRDEIERVVLQLSMEGWQSDQRFAEGFVRQQLDKGCGPIRLRYELRKRGIDDDLIEDCINRIAIDWVEILAFVYKKKYFHGKKLTRQEWAKRVRFMMQRGFYNETIKDLARNLEIKLD